MRQIDYEYGALVGKYRQGGAEVLGEKCSNATLLTTNPKGTCV